MPKGFVLISAAADLRIIQISTVSENGFTATCMLTPIVSLFPFRRARPPIIVLAPKSAG